MMALLIGWLALNVGFAVGCMWHARWLRAEEQYRADTMRQELQQRLAAEQALITAANRQGAVHGRRYDAPLEDRLKVTAYWLTVQHVMKGAP